MVMQFSTGVISARTNYHFSSNEAIATAYADVLEFRLEDARADLSDIKGRDPGNLIVPLLENYCDLIELFLSEDEELLD